MGRITGRIVAVTVALILSTGFSPTYAASTALILKTGSFTLSKESQSISGISLTFDDSASSVFGVELEWRKDDGTAFGAEVFGFSNDWRSNVATSGDNDTFAWMFNLKKYFAPSNTINPYIGAGIGFASADFSGPGGSATGSDFAIQAMAGLEVRVEKVGFYTEIKWFNSKPEDDFGDDIDVSGTGVFAGISIFF